MSSLTSQGHSQRLLLLNKSVDIVRWKSSNHKCQLDATSHSKVRATNSKNLKSKISSHFTSLLIKNLILLVSSFMSHIMYLKNSNATQKSQYLPVRLTTDQARIIFLFGQTWRTTHAMDLSIFHCKHKRHFPISAVRRFH